MITTPEVKEVLGLRRIALDYRMRAFASLRSSRWVGFLLASILGLALYMPFLSIRYDLNGITEASAIEAGGNALFSPNHLLYRPTGFLLYTIFRFFGYNGNSLIILQAFTALCGAATLGVIFLISYHFRQNWAFALLAALQVGTSWSYWSFSTDVSYIVPATTPVAVAYLWSTSERLHRGKIFGISLVCAIAILTWQANLFLLPALCGSVLLIHRQAVPLRRRIVFAISLAGMTLLIIGSTYLLIGSIVLGQWNPMDVLHWTTHYGTPLPMWGHFALNRIPETLKTAVASLVPLWAGIGLHSLMHGTFSPAKSLPLLSLLALLCLTIRCCQALQQEYTRQRSRAVIRALLPMVTYLLYLPFIMWWDPFEPKWFVVPNLFLGITLATTWKAGTHFQRNLLLLICCVSIITSANFLATIWPQHTQTTPYIQRASCVAQHMNHEDVFLATDWDWPGYITYFHHGNMVSLIDISARLHDRGLTLDTVNQQINQVHERGGQVYMMRFGAYPPEYRAWFTAQTQLTVQDLDSYSLQPAFVCGQTEIFALTNVALGTDR